MSFFDELQKLKNEARDRHRKIENDGFPNKDLRLGVQFGKLEAYSEIERLLGFDFANIADHLYEEQEAKGSEDGLGINQERKESNI